MSFLKFNVRLSGSAAQVRDLIDSLYQGYPTGYIITWKNPDVRTKDGGRSNGKKVLIDGQQRNHRIDGSHCGQEVLDEDFNRDRIKIAFNPLASDDSKRFAVQDASHLKGQEVDSGHFCGFPTGI